MQPMSRSCLPHPHNLPRIQPLLSASPVTILIRSSYPWATMAAFSLGSLLPPSFPTQLCPPLSSLNNLVRTKCAHIAPLFRALPCLPLRSESLAVIPTAQVPHELVPDTTDHIICYSPLVDSQIIQLHSHLRVFAYTVPSVWKALSPGTSIAHPHLLQASAQRTPSRHFPRPPYFNGSDPLFIPLLCFVFSTALCALPSYLIISSPSEMGAS